MINPHCAILRSRRATRSPGALQFGLLTLVRKFESSTDGHIILVRKFESFDIAVLKVEFSKKGDGNGFNYANFSDGEDKKC